MSNNTLNVKTSTLDHWREVLAEHAKFPHHEFYIMSDTETTSSEIIDPQTNSINRVIEWALIFCVKTPDGRLKIIKDADDQPIRLCEPLNPWLEPNKTPRQRLTVKTIHPKAIETHGITQEYLMGQSPGLHRPRLKRPASTFDVMFDAVLRILNFPEYLQGQCVFKIVFYNAPFDMRFLNSELEMFGRPPLESYFFVEDALPPLTEVYKKDIQMPVKKRSISLDDAYEWTKKNYPALCYDVDRTIHSASVDTDILFQAYAALSLHKNT